MLEVGTTVVIGDKYAARYNYDSVVGKKGEIYNFNGSTYYVRIWSERAKRLLGWAIQREDCLPMMFDNEAGLAYIEKGDPFDAP